MFGNFQQQQAPSPQPTPPPFHTNDGFYDFNQQLPSRRLNNHPISQSMPISAMDFGNDMRQSPERFQNGFQQHFFQQQYNNNTMQ